jgi:plastocyanin
MRKLLLLPLLVLGLAAAAPASGGEYTASIAPTGFPPLISIENGDTVTWKNNDAVDRQIVADDNSFKSPVLKPGESWSHTFVKGGTYTYHGAFKTNQRGAVEVASVRAVQMQQSAKTVQIFRAVRLQGSISKAGADGEVVSIEARPFGTSEFRQVARTTTLNGVWRVQVKPRRITAYRAVWQNVPSAEHVVNVKPFVRLKQVGRRLFSVQVSADTTLVHRFVVIQRFNKRTHTWRSFRAMRLTRFTAKTGSYTSIANFRATFPHGMIIRALITKRQTLPLMYGPAWSRALRV